MSLALYFDEHVPFAITEGLRRQGVDVLTVQEDDRMGISDSDLLDRATELNRVVFTQDTDFLREASLRQRDIKDFSGVIFAHQLRVPIGQCIIDLELLSTVLEPKDFTNRVQFLPL